MAWGFVCLILSMHVGSTCADHDRRRGGPVYRYCGRKWNKIAYGNFDIFLDLGGFNWMKMGPEK